MSNIARRAGIGSLVEDTTPQLGGNLDLNGNTITGLVIGTDVQAWDADLDKLAGVTHKFDATTLPGVNDDVTGGYGPGSLWVDVTNDKGYVCLDGTDTAAVWTEITQAGSSPALNDVTDVTLTTPATGSVLIKSAGDWVDGLLDTAGLTDAAVTLAKMEDRGAYTIIGRNAGTTGVPAEIHESTLPVQTPPATGHDLFGWNASGVLGKFQMQEILDVANHTGTTQSTITTMSNLVTVGALNSGSITSGFGAIDIGTSSVSAHSGVFVNSGATAGFITLEEPNGDSTVKIQAPALAGNYTLTLPVDDGNASEVLTTNGAGVLSWAAAGAGDMVLDTVQVVTAKKTFGAAGDIGNFAIAGNTSGETIVNATAVASGTLTLPAATDTLVGKQTTDILENKSIDSDSNTITNIVNADIKAAAAIAYSKLNLTGAILDADLAGSIAAAKISGTALTKAQEFTKSITIENPVAADLFAIWITNKAITVTEIQAICEGGTSVALSLEFAATITASGTVVETITPTTTLTSDAAMSGDATIPADNVISVVVGTVTGSVNSVTLSINYTID